MPHSAYCKVAVSVRRRRGVGVAIRFSGFHQIRIPPQWSISCWMIWAVQPVKVLRRV